MTSLDSILKSRDITLSTKVYRVKTMFFPVVMYGYCLVAQFCPAICSPVEIRRVEGAQRKWCRKTSGFLSRETRMPGNFVGRIKGAKERFDLQFLTWDFS